MSWAGSNWRSLLLCPGLYSCEYMYLFLVFFFVCVFFFDVVTLIVLFGEVSEKKIGLLKHAQIKFYITITSIFSDLKQNGNILCGFRSCVVYMFVCAGCNTCYIGETTRHFPQPYEVSI